MLPRRLANLSLTQIFFISSILFPYLQTLAVAPAMSLWTLFLNLIALLVLIGTTGKLRQRGKGITLLYPVLGIAAVVGYCYHVDTLLQIVDYAGFEIRKPGLEAHMTRAVQRPLASESLETDKAGNPKWNNWTDPDITYYTLDSDASSCLLGFEPHWRFWGYAYSPKGRKPNTHNFTYWHQLDGPWYMWVRDGN